MCFYCPKKVYCENITQLGEIRPTVPIFTFILSFCVQSSSVHNMPGTNLPRTLRKLVATQFSPKFRDVVAIAEDPMPQPGDGEVLIKNRQVKNFVKK